MQNDQLMKSAKKILNPLFKYENSTFESISNLVNESEVTCIESIQGFERRFASYDEEQSNLQQLMSEVQNFDQSKDIQNRELKSDIWSQQREMLDPSSYTQLANAKFNIQQEYEIKRLDHQIQECKENKKNLRNKLNKLRVEYEQLKAKYSDSLKDHDIQDNQAYKQYTEEQRDLETQCEKISIQQNIIPERRPTIQVFHYIFIINITSKLSPNGLDHINPARFKNGQLHSKLFNYIQVELYRFFKYLSLNKNNQDIFTLITFDDCSSSISLQYEFPKVYSIRKILPFLKNRSSSKQSDLTLATISLDTVLQIAQEDEEKRNKVYETKFHESAFKQYIPVAIFMLHGKIDQRQNEMSQMQLAMSQSKFPTLKSVGFLLSKKNYLREYASQPNLCFNLNSPKPLISMYEIISHACLNPQIQIENMKKMEAQFKKQVVQTKQHLLSQNFMTQMAFRNNYCSFVTNIDEAKLQEIQVKMIECEEELQQCISTQSNLKRERSHQYELQEKMNEDKPSFEHAMQHQAEQMFKPSTLIIPLQCGNHDELCKTLETILFLRQSVVKQSTSSMVTIINDIKSISSTLLQGILERNDNLKQSITDLEKAITDGKNRQKLLVDEINKILA